jgi:tetratricopeptide (TPR) repeat protein
VIRGSESPEGSRRNGLFERARVLKNTGFRRSVTLRLTSCGASPASAARWKTTAREHHFETAPTLSNLGGLLYRMKRYSESEDSYRRALILQETCVGRDHADVATTLSNLATVWQATGRYGEAEDLPGSVGSYRTLLGPQHPKVAKILNNVGVVRARVGRYEEAAN